MEEDILENKKGKKEITLEQRKSVLTTFLLLFPSLIIAGLTTVTPSKGLSVLVIAMFIYQAILLRNFVNDHYQVA